MKTNRIVLGGLVLGGLLACAYTLGYQHGRSSTGASLNPPGSLRQIGLAFRNGRNDWTAPFSTTGAFAARSELRREADRK